MFFFLKKKKKKKKKMLVFIVDSIPFFFAGEKPGGVPLKRWIKLLVSTKTATLGGSEKRNGFVPCPLVRRLMDAACVSLRNRQDAVLKWGIRIPLRAWDLKAIRF